MPLQKDRISQLSDRLKARKETESVQSSSEISTRYDRVGALADELTRWGYSTKAPERKTADELFIGGGERAAQIPEYTVPEQKPRFTLPSSAPRTEKNSPTSTTSGTVWGSSSFGPGAQMPTFDSKKLTAGDVAESVAAGIVWQLDWYSRSSGIRESTYPHVSALPLLKLLRDRLQNKRQIEIGAPTGLCARFHQESFHMDTRCRHGSNMR